MSILKTIYLQHLNGANANMTLSVNGNVGIGNTSPQHKLHVDGGKIFCGREDTSSEGGQISFGRASDGVQHYSIDCFGGSTTPSLRFIDDTAAAVRMSIDSSGNVTKPYQPAFIAYMTSNQTTTAGGQILFDALSSEIPSIRSAGYSTTNKRYTAPVTGLYQFSVSLDFGGAYSSYYFWCGINGAIRSRDFLENITIGGSGGVYSTFCMYMNSGDYIQIHAGNASLILNGGNAIYNCVWQGHLIG